MKKFLRASNSRVYILDSIMAFQGLFHSGSHVHWTNRYAGLNKDYYFHGPQLELNYNMHLLTHLALKCIYDELQSMRVNTLDTFLDHVVTVLVLDAFEHVTVQFHYEFVLQREKGKTCYPMYQFLAKIQDGQKTRIIFNEIKEKLIVLLASEHLIFFP